MKIMKYNFVFVIISSILVLSVYAEKVEQVEYPIILNNEVILSFHEPLYTIKDNLYVPSKKNSKQLGIEIFWNEKKEQVEMKMEFLYDLSDAEGTKENPIYVSITNLIAEPHKYHNKYVALSGIGHIEFEEYEIYFSRDDWEYGNFYNAIGLDIEQNFCIPIEEAKLLNGKYVEVVGKYIAPRERNLDPYQGQLTDITRYNKLLSRTDIERLDKTTGSLK